MQAVWKFRLDPMNIQQLIVPHGATFLSVGCQGETLNLWALVGDTPEREERYIEVYGTGQEIPTGMGISRRFIGTALMNGGELVWHVFERTDHL